MEDEVRTAIVEELRRQAENAPSALRVAENGDRLEVEGEVDLDALAMAVVGAVAGGP